MLLNNEWVNSEIKEELKKDLETNENGQQYKVCGTQRRQC